MFKKILIANRGEIACRIIKTLKSMKILSVAVFSDIDKTALHVEMADVSIPIGGSTSQDSYLSIDKIIKAIRVSGAEAVHPGYGFLSENYDFALRLEQEGIPFIGPHSKLISLMGDKIKSKEFAVKAGLRVVPGDNKAQSDSKAALDSAQSIGFPVMLKAAAGGGGKGMRIVENKDCFESSFQLAQNEAHSSFNDNRVFIEKFIEDPHHVEVQIIGDKYGKIVHLNERECSIQRRHQKILEETPSPFIDIDTRLNMTTKALALARAANYYSAGTVEFLVDKNLDFYFLEMNTRIQVEHPISEIVSGIDLVELMIRVEAGERISQTQEDINPKGHAIEVRIYAEDPIKNFFPSTGRITKFFIPTDNKFIRLDSGVSEGSEISVYYDPMLAKLIAHAPTRNEACKVLTETLERARVSGVVNNMLFLIAILNNKKFQTGNVNTNFIADEWPTGFTYPNLSVPVIRELIAAISYVHTFNEQRNFGERFKKDLHFPLINKWHISIDNQHYGSEVKCINDKVTVVLDQDTYTIKSDWQTGDYFFSGYLNKNFLFLQIQKNDRDYILKYKESLITLHVNPPSITPFLNLVPKKAERRITNNLISPMPGLLISILVKEGELVGEGQELAIIEAMKMENILRSDKECIISKIYLKEGDNVSSEEILMDFKES